MATDPDSIRERDTLSGRCPGCGGELRAETHFAWRRGPSMTNPDEEEPFWSTSCLVCSHRFDYVPGSGEIRRFEP